MNEQTEQNIKTKLENHLKTYTTLEELEEMIADKIAYIEFVNMIKKLINNGIKQIEYLSLKK